MPGIYKMIPITNTNLISAICHSPLHRKAAYILSYLQPFITIQFGMNTRYKPRKGCLGRHRFIFRCIGRYNMTEYGSCRFTEGGMPRNIRREIRNACQRLYLWYHLCWPWIEIIILRIPANNGCIHLSHI